MIVSAQFVMDGASIHNPMEESQSTSFIFEGGIEPIQTHGISQDFVLHPIAAKSYCGDGVRDAGEQCDGNNLASATCVTRGYSAGALTCNSTCTFNETTCTAASSSSVQNAVGNDGVRWFPPRSSRAASPLPYVYPHLFYVQKSAFVTSIKSLNSTSTTSSFSSIPFKEEARSSSQQSRTMTARSTRSAQADDTLHTSAPIMQFNWHGVLLLLLLLLIALLFLMYLLFTSSRHERAVSTKLAQLQKQSYWIALFGKSDNEEDDSDE